MTRQLFKDAFFWGCTLWLIGYVLGILLFPFVPQTMIGWVIMPFGVLTTFWVLMRKVKGSSFRYYIILGICWSVIAVLLDYFLLVRVFKPADGYYKFDVYLYYVLMFALPIVVGWKKSLAAKSKE